MGNNPVFYDESDFYNSIGVVGGYDILLVDDGY